MEVEYNWKISGDGSEAADRLRETREITDAPDAAFETALRGALRELMR